MNDNTDLFDGISSKEMDRLFDSTSPTTSLKELKNNVTDTVKQAAADILDNSLVSKYYSDHDDEPEIETKSSQYFNPHKKSYVKPHMNDIDDAITRQLMENSWERIESEIGSGAFTNNPILTPSFIAQLNYSVAEQLPHREFMPVRVSECPIQTVYRAPPIDLSFDPSERAENHRLQRLIVQADTSRYNATVSTDLLHEHLDADYDLQRDMVEMLSQEVLRELHTDMLSNLSACGTATNAVTSTSDSVNAEDVLSEIMKAADKINEANRFEQQKWAIMSPELAFTIINDAKYGSHFDTSKAERRGVLSDFLGSLCGVNVYIDGGLNTNEMLVGNKGTDSRLCSGISYHPHTMAIPCSTIVEPTMFDMIVPFVRRDSYLIDEQALDNIHKITFKREVITSESDELTDNYEVPQEITLIDIDITHGPDQQLTFAAIFDGYETKENNYD